MFGGLHLRGTNIHPALVANQDPFFYAYSRIGSAFYALFSCVKKTQFFSLPAKISAYLLRNFMSNTNTANKQKRGRPALKITKTRASLSLHPTLIKAARKMAYTSGMSLSVFVEAAIRSQLQPGAKES